MATEKKIATIFSPNEKSFLEKTYLGPKGYTVFKKDLTEQQILQIKKDLTFQARRCPGYGEAAEPFCILRQSKEKLFLPKFYGIEKFGPPKKNHIQDGEKININFSFNLWPKQIYPVQKALEAAKKVGGGVLCSPCGSGKTGMMCKIISDLGVKTLVIVNRDFLMVQWMERIEQFLPIAKIGILQGKTIDIEGKDIVIGMLKSIATCKYYDRSLYKSFGMVVYDEVHSVPSNCYSQSLIKVQTRYHFGLSATPTRQDGLSKVTQLSIGPIFYRPNTRLAEKNPKNTKAIMLRPTYLPDTKHYEIKLNYRRRPDVVRMLSGIIQCPLRLAYICVVLKQLVEDGRHILVLSERIQYLRDIERQLGKVYFKIGYYIGGMKAVARKESEKADVILASYSMAKEAMDIPILDTLFMVTSKGKIEQCVGRIQRKNSYPEKRPPLVVDLIDPFSSFESQAKKRKTFYNKKEYPIQMVSFSSVKDLEKQMKIAIENIKISDVIDISDEEEFNEEDFA